MTLTCKLPTLNKELIIIIKGMGPIKIHNG